MRVAFHSSRGYCTLMVWTLKGPGLFQLVLRLVLKSEYSSTLKKQMFLLEQKSYFHHHKAFTCCLPYSIQEISPPTFFLYFPHMKMWWRKSSLSWFGDSLHGNRNSELLKCLYVVTGIRTVKNKIVNDKIVVNIHLTSPSTHWLENLKDR